MHGPAHQVAWCFSSGSSVLRHDVILGHFIEGLRAGGKVWGSLYDCDIAVAVVGLESGLRRVISCAQAPWPLPGLYGFNLDGVPKLAVALARKAPPWPLLRVLRPSWTLCSFTVWCKGSGRGKQEISNDWTW